MRHNFSFAERRRVNKRKNEEKQCVCVCLWKTEKLGRVESFWCRGSSDEIISKCFLLLLPGWTPRGRKPSLAPIAMQMSSGEGWRDKCRVVAWESALLNIYKSASQKFIVTQIFSFCCSFFFGNSSLENGNKRFFFYYSTEKLQSINKAVQTPSLPPWSPPYPVWQSSFSIWRQWQQ